MQKAKKQLGQNFLTDTNKVNEIVKSLHIANKHVLEIGPGYGAMTLPMSKVAKTITAFEIDKDVIDFFEENKVSNLELIHQDFLKTTDLDRFNDYVFVSNLPYYISTKILFRVIDETTIKSVNVMLQKELITRIISIHNKKTYGRLSVMIQSLFDITSKISVPSQCFTPSPKVESGFISLSRKEDSDISSTKDYSAFVAACFKSKRKTLLNSLKDASFTKVNLVKAYLELNDYKDNIRAEQLAPNEFIEIYKKLYK